MDKIQNILEKARQSSEYREEMEREIRELRTTIDIAQTKITHCEDIIKEKDAARDYWESRCLKDNVLRGVIADRDAEIDVIARHLGRYETYLTETDDYIEELLGAGKAKDAEIEAYRKEIVELLITIERLNKVRR